MQRRALLGLAALAAVSCDQTVDLDFTRLSFTDLYVSGACPVSPDLSEVTFSFVLRNGVDSSVGEEGQLLPLSKIAQETKNVGELMGTDNISFSLPSIAQEEVGRPIGDPAYAEAEAGYIDGVGLIADEVSFDYNGGAERRDDPRLLILLMDQSGTLSGRDPQGIEPPNPALASDRKDERLTFFRQLVRSLPSDVQVSLVPFSGSFANIDNSAPSLNRGQLDVQLGDLARDEQGGSPLNDALNRGFTIADQLSNDLNPSVVIFTDGLEGGDSSGDGSPENFEAQLNSFVQGGIPVSVVHLQPPTGSPEEWRGRSSLFARLACTTGGQYLFLERPDQFSESNSSSRLEQILRSRVTGTWRVRTRTTLNNPSFESGAGVFLSTEFGVSLGENTRFDSLYRSLESTLRDNRVWLYKQ